MALNLSQLDGTNGFRLDGIDAYDQSGFSVAGAGDVNGDGFDDLIVGSLADSYYSSPPGKSFVVFGGPDGFPASLDLASLDGTSGFRIDGIGPGDLGGFSVAGAGDVNGDGIDDIAIGAVGVDSYTGENYVVFGTTEGFAATLDLETLDGSNGFVLDGIDEYDICGRSVAGAGDVNGDGIEDLIVGAFRGDPNDVYGAGESYVVFGTSEGFPAHLDLAALDGENGFRIDGVAGDDFSGFDVSGAGDVNGDGIDDLIVGAPNADANGQYDSGVSYIVFGSEGGFAASLDLSALDGSNGLQVHGVANSDFAGYAVAGAGDVNGDGVDDLIVGARGVDRDGGYDVGASYVVFGSSDGFSASFDLGSLDGTNGFRIDGIDAYDQSGFSVAGAGDLNGDGFGDLIVGAPGANDDGDYGVGKSYVIFGSGEGFAPSIDLAALDGSQGFRLVGVDSGDQSGIAVAGAGDVNGDGLDDLIVGARGADADGVYDSGESYVVFGSAQLGGANDAPEVADDVLVATTFDRVDLAADHGAGADRDPDFDDLTMVAIDGVAVAPGGSVTLASGLRVTLVGGTEVRLDAPNVALGKFATEFTYELSDGRGRSDTATVSVDFTHDAIGLGDLGGALDLSHLDGVIGFRLDGVDAHDGSGRSVAATGDVNGDGIGDLIVGAPSAGPDDAGASYVVFGTDAGFAASVDLATLDGSNGFRVDGVDAYDRSGLSVAGAGDVNGDGFDDIIVGASSADAGGDYDAGQSFIVFGSGAGFPAVIDLGTLDGANGFRLDGIDTYDQSGFSVSGAGDVNGDGVADLIVGARFAEGEGSYDAGESYVVFGSTDGFSPSLDPSALDGTDGFRLVGTGADERSGYSVASAGDVNGDGIDDLIVGAPGTDAGGRSDAGASYVVFGSDAGFAASVDLTTLDGSNGFRLDGVADYDLSGYSVAGAGDVNGDGIDDLIVGALGADSGGNDGAGAGYVVFGSSDGFAASVDLGALDGTDGFRLDGADVYDQAGVSVAGAGDVNGDGFDDLIVGARGADSDGDYNAGASYLVFGSGAGFVASVDLAALDGSKGFRLDGIDGFDQSGVSVAGAGDVNGDGIDDLIVGAYGANPDGHNDAGESYVIFGSTQLGGANDAPLAADDVLSVGPFDRVDLAADHGAGSDRDPDFDALVIVTIDGVTVAPGDSVVLSSGLRVTFLGGTEVRFEDPALRPGTRLSDNFEYEISDGRGGTDAATVTVDFAQDAMALASLDGANGLRLFGGDSDRTGYSVAGAGDVNGDGIDDLIVGAPGSYAYGQYHTGASYVVFGSRHGFAESLDLSTLDGSNGFRLDGIDQYDDSGSSVASAGDINGDGIGDLIVGARGADGEGIYSTGESYVVFGTNTGFAATLNLGVLDGNNGFRLDGSDASDLSGFSVARAGDVNGDGIDDLIVGAPDADPGRKGSAGESYVVFGSRDGFDATLDLSALDGSQGFRIDGTEVYASSGRSVAAAGDVNGDGIDDIVVGAPGLGPDGAGAAYVVFGTRAGFGARIDLSALDGSDGFRLDGVAGFDSTGVSVASAGDFNGDGIGDLIVGADGADADGSYDAGASYVVFGSGDGFAPAIDLASLDGSNGFRLNGIGSADQCGHSVAGAGDFNGDGFDDLVVGARSADTEGGYDAGESYIVFGSSSGFAATLDLASLDGKQGFRLDGIDGYDNSGWSVAGAGDVNGDGLDDLIIGAPYADADGNYDAGESYVIFGFRTGSSSAAVAADVGRSVPVDIDAGPAFPQDDDFDFVTDGTNTISFDDRLGRRDVSRITDVDAVTDKFEFNGASIAQAIEDEDRSILLLEGTDRDAVVPPEQSEAPFDLLI